MDLIVCTDAEEILGIGDWGVGGIQISVGKLAVYTAAAGIDPRRVIPVSLDVGTDNEGLLNDPLYLGNRHARVRGTAYDAFIGKYLQTASSAVPGRAAALRGLRRGQRPADPGQLPGQVPDLQRRHAGHRRRRDGRAVQRAEGHRHPVAGPAGGHLRRRHRRGRHRRSDPRRRWSGTGWTRRRPRGRSGSWTCPACSPTTWATACWTTSVPTPARPPRPPAGPRRRCRSIRPPLQRWPQMAALRQARAASGIITLETVVEHVKPTILDRLLDRARGVHPAGHRDDERRRGAAGHLPDLQPDLADRGDAGRHHRLVQGPGAGGHRPADPAAGLRRRAV